MKQCNAFLVHILQMEMFEKLWHKQQTQTLQELQAALATPTKTNASPMADDCVSK